MKYRIRRISTGSIVRFGCLLGWIVTVIPGLLCGLAGWRLAVGLRGWLQSWENVTLSFLGFEYTLDLADLLQLEGVLNALQTIENRALPLMLALLVAVAVLGGLVIALVSLLLGWGYNLLAWLTGGVTVELQEVPAGPPARRQP
jgi:hypothetical protein